MDSNFSADKMEISSLGAIESVNSDSSFDSPVSAEDLPPGLTTLSNATASNFPLRDKPDNSSPSSKKLGTGPSSGDDTPPSGQSQPIHAQVTASNLTIDKPILSGPESMELESESTSVDTPLSEDLAFSEYYKIIIEDPINRDLVEQIDNDPAYIQFMQNMKLIVKAMHYDGPLQFDIEAYATSVKQVYDSPELMAKFKQLAVACELVCSMSGKKITHADVSPYSDICEGRHLTNKDSKLDLVEACKRSFESYVGHSVGLEYKLVNGDGINQLNKYGKTALHSACAKGKIKLAKFLIENGAKVDALDVKGNAPLHYAAIYGWEQCVELLLKYKADVTIVNSGGKTPRGLAELENHTDVMLLLKEDEEKPGLEKNM